MEKNTIECLEEIQENIMEGNYDVANDLIEELKIGIHDGSIEIDW